MDYQDVLNVIIITLLSIFETLKITLITLCLSLVYGVKAFIPSAYMPKKSVDHEVVLITGGGSGIGRLMAQKFIGLNAKVVILDVNQHGLDETVKLVKASNSKARIYAYKCDLSNKDQIYETADKVKREVGDVDILINNAGIVTGKHLMDCSDDQITRTMNVNCLAHFWIVKSFLPRMKERNYGHIVTISSIAGIIGLNNLTDYCASKFAAVGFHESLQFELRAMGFTNIQMTLICPYYINTGMFDGVTTKFKWSLPIMEPEYAVGKILDAILSNQKMLAMPKLLYLFIFLKGLLPVEVGFYLGKVMEVMKSMDNFRGRPKVE